MVTVAEQALGIKRGEAWPVLPLSEWRDTYDTLHMWLEIVGKIRLGLSPLQNHWWNVPLYVTARGLSTAAMPYGERTLQVDFDFVEHELVIENSEGQRKLVALVPRTVRDFYREVMSCLDAMGMPVKIWTVPVEVSNPIPFEQDVQHGSYDAAYVDRLWRVLLSTRSVFEEFRGRFMGKCSPVHLFWGSFDLAVTRFSGKSAPPRPRAGKVEQEAYSHECISHGFWPGGDWFGKEIPEAIYYSYTVPAPEGLGEARIRPEGAHFDSELAEFVIRYEGVRTAPSPREALMAFLQSTYEAGAERARWDRGTLERVGEQ